MPIGDPQPFKDELKLDPFTHYLKIGGKPLLNF